MLCFGLRLDLELWIGLLFSNGLDAILRVIQMVLRLFIPFLDDLVGLLDVGKVTKDVELGVIPLMRPHQVRLVIPVRINAYGAQLSHQ